jgi:hypothetical protein
LTPDQIKRASAAIRDGKTAVNEKTGIRGRARVRGGEGAARKSVRLLHAVLSWAIDEGLAKTNPAASVKTGADGKGDPLRQSASPPIHEENRIEYGCVSSCGGLTDPCPFIVGTVWHRVWRNRGTEFHHHS